MAKLMGRMLLAVWLIVALAVSVRSGDWSPRRFRSRVTACIKEMVNSKLETANWLGKIKESRGEIDCNDRGFERHLLEEQVTSSYPKTHEFMNEYLKRYLHECRLEESFKGVIGKLEQGLDRRWESADGQSLFSYVKSKSWNGHNVGQLLGVIRNLSGLNSAPGEIECTKENNIQLKALIKNENHYEDLREFVKDYYKLYLVKCGYEDRFQQAIGNLEQLPYEHWDSAKFSTLYSYLMAEFFGPDEVVESLELIYETFKPSSDPTSSACTQEDETNLLSSFSESRRYEYFHKLVGAYLASYFVKCGLEDEFKKVTDYIEPVWKQPSWNLFSEIVTSRRSVEDMKLPILVIRELSGLVNKFREADCADELGAYLMQLPGRLEHHHNLRLLSLAYLGLYLDKCGFEARFKESIDKFVQVLPEKSRKPEFYPKLISQISESWKQWSAESLLDVLPAVQVLFKFESFSKETHCNNELISSLVYIFFQNKFKKKYNHLISDHIAYYLDVCGIEQSFRKRFGIEQSRSKTTLFEYLHTLSDLHPEKAWQQLIMSIISELSKSSNAQTKLGCSKDLMRDFSTFLTQVRPNAKHYSLYIELKEHLADYKNKCEGLTV